MTQETTINVRTMLELAFEESIVLEAYLDSRKNWTWSAGLTSKSGHNVERYIDNPSTLEVALSVWQWALQKYAADVLKAFAGYELKQHEFDAALMFHWNTGAIKTASWVSLVKAGKTGEAYDAFLWWNQPSEIIPRRKRERELFFSGTYHNDGTASIITKVDSKHRPIYSSAKKVNITQELENLLGVGTKPAALAEMPAVVATPTPQIDEKPAQSYTLADAWRSFNLWLIRVFG